MPRKFYIADLCLGDSQCIWLDNRPFLDAAHMTAAIAENWKRTVNPEDTVYVLGGLSDTMPAASQDGILYGLPGHKILIRDADPEDAQLVPNGYDGAYASLSVTDDGCTVHLSHRPMAVYPGIQKGAMHFYGSVHDSYEQHAITSLRDTLEGLYNRPVRMYNVGCMMPWMGYVPRTLREVQEGYAKCRLNRAYGTSVPRAQKILTLSTAHISERTAQMLDQESESNAMGLAVYPKCGDRSGGAECFGWFIYLPDRCGESVPEDLKSIIERARAMGCGVLCLDADGEEWPALRTYDW